MNGFPEFSHAEKLRVMSDSRLFTPPSRPFPAIPAAGVD
jgi:hypothetical protein